MHFFLSVKLEKQLVSELVRVVEMKCTLKTCMSLMVNLLSVRMLYIVESDNKGIPEGNDRIYFEESDIYFAAPEKTLLERAI